MVLPTCFVNIPSLPYAVNYSGYPVPAILGYASTNTNYFGATSCGLSSYIRPTPYTMDAPIGTAKCTLPASVSGKAYSVTPVVIVPRRASSTVKYTQYFCDPVPVTAINKGNFQFACKSLRGKDIGDTSDYHTISWYGIPAGAGVTVEPFSFFACPATSTPTYVVNTARASTTLVPTTEVRVDVTSSTTRTMWTTTTVGVPTGTTTCLVTVTATAAPAPVTQVRRADDDANSQPDPVSDPAAVDVDSGHDLVSDDANGNDNTAETVVELQERAATTPTIGKPDFTYPPYGVTTIYVKSISTSLWTYSHVFTYYETPPVVTATLSYLAYTLSTVTITVTPTPRATAV